MDKNISKIKNNVQDRNSEAWIKHIDHFNENFGNEIANIFEVENVFSYGDISSKLKSKLNEFGTINFFILKAK